MLGSKNLRASTVLYIKSLVIGVLMVFAAMIIYVVLAMMIFLRSHTVPPGAEVSFDLRFFASSTIFWVIAIAAFVLGFYWEFRRGRLTH